MAKIIKGSIIEQEEKEEARRIKVFGLTREVLEKENVKVEFYHPPKATGIEVIVDQIKTEKDITGLAPGNSSILVFPKKKTIEVYHPAFLEMAKKLGETYEKNEEPEYTIIEYYPDTQN